MKTIDQVRSNLTVGSFDFSRHALNRAVERNISEREIKEAGAQATIIEHYPDDKYSSSCLLLGRTLAGRPLHIQVSLAETRLLRIVTLYEPDPKEWADFSRRR